MNRSGEAVNLAPFGSVRQSGNSSSNASGRAVDGNKTDILNGLYCVDVQMIPNRKAWLEVKLNKVSFVYNVRFFSFLSGAKKIRNAECSNRSINSSR